MGPSILLIISCRHEIERGLFNTGGPGGKAPAGGYDYSTCMGVKARVNDGKLWAAVNHVTGFSPMPKNGNKLSDCELKQIKNGSMRVHRIINV